MSIDVGEIALSNATAQIEACQPGATIVHAFFDEPTFTVSYVVHDPATRCAAIIDSVLNFDLASGRAATASADALVAYVTAQNLKVEWLLETHAHADHLSAATYLRAKVGGQIAIGEHIVTVQRTFGDLFNTGADFLRDGSNFDRLFADGDNFALGNVAVTVLHVPGHTPACVAYVIGDAVFVGDTLFMPDYGTARADFPGGDARQLFQSIRRILALPATTRLFMCHDYLPKGRHHFVWQCTVADQRTRNVHAHDGIDENSFVAMRTNRDAKLAMPHLLLPSVQVNMRAGHWPPPEANGISYLKIPVNVL